MNKSGSRHSHVLHGSVSLLSLVAAFRSLGCLLPGTLLCLFTVVGQTGAQESPLHNKTMVAWVQLDDLDQRGGSVLTINDTRVDRFDAIVFGELRAGTWMPGSNGFQRTQQDQSTWFTESEKRPVAALPREWICMALTYSGRQVRLYRNGQLLADYEAETPECEFDRHSAILIGPRHLRPGVEVFRGKVREIRVYPRALGQEAIDQLVPGVGVEASDLWAWWDFAATGTYERTGRFNQVTLTGGAAIEGDALVLKGERPTLLAKQVVGESKQTAVPTSWSVDEAVPEAVVASSRVLREKLLSDSTRPYYHFCVPEDQGMPGDPNGCFYANGRYHLMYLYRRAGTGFCWGHVSSSDLLHWRHHADAIGPGDGDEGCFSGGAFVDDDGSVHLSYWMLWGAKGIGLASSLGKSLENWKKSAANPVIRSTEFGVTETKTDDGQKLAYGSADPSNIWKHQGRYYMLTGNLPVLNKYGRQDGAAVDMRGDRAYLFESTDLVTWAYLGPFYERDSEWTDDSEDNMCPSFLPLPAAPDGSGDSGKHLLLFISHNRGCQYYVGEYDTQRQKFVPERHGRMTWVDNTYFAPEALVDQRGRQIMWAWLTDNPAGDEQRGWSGVYGLPRTLWWDGQQLRMRPVPEVKQLRAVERDWGLAEVPPQQGVWLEDVQGDCCELQLSMKDPSSSSVLRVRADPKMQQFCEIYYDADKQLLCMDTTKSGNDGRQVLETAPLTLEPGERLELRVFVDRSVIEVYANDRQAICRRVYPAETSNRIQIFNRGESQVTVQAKGWTLHPSNPF